MSSRSHSRNWRPGGGRRRKSSRKQKIAGLAAVLFLLLSFGIWIIWPGSTTPVQFVSIVETGYEQQRLSPNSAALGDVEQLQTVFTGLNEQNSARVAAPVKTDLAKLKTDLADVPRNAALVVYCSVNAVAQIEKDDVLDLQLLSGSGDADTSLRSLLDTLLESSPASVVLLLDVSQTRPGLTTGVLANDNVAVVRHILESAKDGDAKDHPYRRLTVICSAASGERNWPVISRTPQTTAPAEPGSPATPDRISFSGTAFGHAVAQAFQDGKAETIGDLEAAIRSSVDAKSFGGTQTIARFDGGRTASSASLLTQVVYKAPASESAEKTEEPAAAEGDAPAAESTASRPRDATPSEKMAALWKQRDELREQGIAAAVAWREWLNLQQLLLSADLALRQNDDDTFARCHDSADALIRTIQKTVGGATSSVVSRELQELRLWVQPPLAEDTSDKDAGGAENRTRPPDPRGVMDQVTSAQEGDRLTPARDYFAEDRNRLQFIDWLVGDHLQELAASFDQLPAEQRTEAIQQWPAFLKNLNRSGAWRSDEWPHELVALNELFPRAQSSSRALSLLSKILTARRQTLRLATGFASGGEHLRAAAWNRIQTNIEQALIRTTAAERWLAVGDEALTLAEKQLDEANRILGEAQTTAATINRDQAVLDAKHAELPALLELLAQQQERVVLSGNELTSASQISDATGGAAVNVRSFPQAVLNSTNLQGSFDDMVALSEPQGSPVGVDDQVTRFTRLRSVAEGMFASASRGSLAVDQQFDVLNDPWVSFEQREQISLALQKVSPSGGTRSQGMSETGLWMAFWSIRALSATGYSDADTELWTLWSQLVADLQRDEASDGRTIDAIKSRVVLGTRLRSAWNSLLSGQDTEAPALLTSEEDFRSLIQDDLQRHSSVGDYAQRLRQLFDLRAARPVSALAAISKRLETSDAGSVTVPIAGVPEGDSIYVFSELMRPEGARQDPGDGRWKTLHPAADNLLRLSVASSGSSHLKQVAPVVIVRVDAYGIVQETTSLTVFPATDPSLWDIAFYSGNKKILSRIGANGKLLELIPKTPADAPLPLSVRLVRPPGDIMPQADVQIFVRDENSELTEIGAKRTVSFSETDNEAAIPLLPPAEGQAPPAAAAAAPAAPQFLISHGLQFRVTPLSPAGKSATVQVDVYPDPYGADQYVVRPTPQYDASSRTLSIPLRRNTILDESVLRPAKLPVDVKLNRGLQNLVEVPFSGLADLESEQIARITFQPQIEQELRGGNSDLEFSVSAAGVPAAWRWKLSRSGNPELLQGEHPSIHADLQLLNPDAVKAQWLNNELLLGADWKTAEFRGEVEIHGGTESLGSGNEYLVRVEVLQGNNSRTSYPLIKLRGPRVSSAIVRPGEGVGWLLSTDTKLPEVDFSDFRTRLGEGRFTLRSTLRQTEPPADLGSDDAAFTFDVSEPEIVQIELPRNDQDVTKTLRGSVRVRDDQSGIKSVAVGFDEGKLKEIPLPESGGVFEPEQQARFEFPPADLGSLVPPVPPNQRQRNQQTAELYVKVTNRVGLFVQDSRRVLLYREPGPEMKETRPNLGAVVVTFSSRAVFDVELKGPTPGMKKSPGKGGSVTFSDLQPGTYDLTWKNSYTKKSGSKSGIKITEGSVTVAAE
ncbi:MAG: hypothetical protein R3C19_01465 [Planctomycetaceae bacterium]